MEETRHKEGEIGMRGRVLVILGKLNSSADTIALVTYETSWIYQRKS